MVRLYPTHDWHIFSLSDLISSCSGPLPQQEPVDVLKVAVKYTNVNNMHEHIIIFEDILAFR